MSQRDDDAAFCRALAARLPKGMTTIHLVCVYEIPNQHKRLTLGVAVPRPMTIDEMPDEIRALRTRYPLQLGFVCKVRVSAEEAAAWLSSGKRMAEHPSVLALVKLD